MAALLRRKSVVIGLVGVAAFFMGQFALFTYLRPFLEQVTNVGLAMLSVLLLVVGADGFIGTTLVGLVIGKRLHILLAAPPAILALIAADLALFGNSLAAVMPLLALWGFVATATPVIWWTWLTRVAPDGAEAGGGLMVAVVQFAIMTGATVGGMVFDTFGPVTEFLVSAAILVLASAVALACEPPSGHEAT